MFTLELTSVSTIISQAGEHTGKYTTSQPCMQSVGKVVVKLEYYGILHKTKQTCIYIVSLPSVHMKILHVHACVFVGKEEVPY